MIGSGRRAKLTGGIVLALTAGGGCGYEEFQAAPGGETGARPLGPHLYSVASPATFAATTREGSQEFADSLDRIRLALPQVSMVAVFFDEQQTTREDWLAILDVCRAKGFRAVVAFATVSGRDHEGFRPVRGPGGWELGGLGRFVADRACVTHPALYALTALDEPWHHQKQPFYTTDALKDLYSTLKSLAPGADFDIMVQFSREIWRYLVDTPRPGLYWDHGICDIVQISALEFQDSRYLFDQLDSNHYWSRRIIHEKTPEIPLWTSVQVMGNGYGPSAGYWFPRERDGHQDLLRLLTDVTSERYEAEHRLTGLMLQAWESLTVDARPHQYRLGDRDAVGTPVSQEDAARDALATLARWMAANAANASLER